MRASRIVLGGAGLLDEAHAAMDLHAGRGDLVAEVGEPRLHDRNQQVDPVLVSCGRSVLVGMLQAAPSMPAAV